MRLLEQKLDHKFPVTQILESIKKYNCIHLDTNNWQFTSYDGIIEACGKAFDIELNKKYRTQQEILPQRRGPYNGEFGDLRGGAVG